ncbi:MAG: autotransporter-associated beta strand repeat-containing protein [Gammaproteobacteria bacterium]|nr:autotransporter-associated beta strand repeat-containing protein [Gammaproteobacteria bacterium]
MAPPPGRRYHRRRALRVCVAVAALLLPWAASARSLYYFGWFDDTEWDSLYWRTGIVATPTRPEDGDTLTFGYDSDSVWLSPYNDFADLDVDLIRFYSNNANGGSFRLVGNDVDVYGGIINQGHAEANIDLDLNVRTSQSWYNSTSDSYLDINGDVAIDSGKTLTIDSGRVSLDGDLSGDAMTALRKRDTGTLKLGGNNSAFLGKVLLEGGTLRLAGGDNLSNRTRVEMSAATILDLDGTDENFGNVSGERDTFIDLSGGAALAVGFDDQDSAFLGEIGGSGSLRKAGSGTLELDTVWTENLSNGGTFQFIDHANSYTGGTYFDGGTLRVHSNKDLGATSGGLTFDGGTLGTATTFSSARQVTLNAGGGRVRVDGNTALTLSGVVAGAGRLIAASRLVGGAGGTLVLSGANTYSGGTRIDADTTLRITNDSNLGAGGGIIEFNGGTLATRTSFTTSRNLILTGGGVLDVLAGTRLTATGHITYDPGNVYVYGDPGTLVKAGDGTLVLTGGARFSTYRGQLKLEGGRLEIDSNLALGNPLNSFHLTRGTFATTASFTMDRYINLSSTSIPYIEVAPGTTLTSTGTMGAAGGSHTIRKSGGGTLSVLGGDISGVLTYRVDAGRLVGDTNSIRNFVNSAVVNYAEVEFAQHFDGEVIGSVSGPGTLFKTGAGTLTITSGTSTGSWVVLDGRMRASPKRIQGTIVNDAEVEFTESGNASFASSMSGVGKLIKTDGGRVTLAGVNTYAGDTEVDGGTLALGGDGQLNSLSALHVAAGAQLDLSGWNATTLANALLNDGLVNGGLAAPKTLTGNVTGSGAFAGAVAFGGHYAPGHSPALVVHDDTTFLAGNVLDMELGGLLRGDEYDAIDADTLVLGGTLKLNFLDLGSGLFVPQAGQQFDLLVANSITGLFDVIDTTDAVLAEGLFWTHGLVALGDQTAFRLVVAAAAPVPLPAAAWLLAPALLLLPTRRRKRPTAARIACTEGRGLAATRDDG